jgi:putative Holliday junction resolvase
LSLRPGVRLGVDVGEVRIGIAACDPGGVLATPVETVAHGRGDMQRIAELVSERDAIEVVVGLPRSLSGGEGPAAEAVRGFAQRLARHVAPCPVRLVDERLSTVRAGRAMRASGVSSRESRGTIDQAAAVVILQDALDFERTSGRAPGETVQLER